MQRLLHLRIRAKLLAVFALLTLFTLGLGGFAAMELRAVNGAAAEIRENWLPSTRHLGRMAEHAMRYRQLQAALLLAEGPEARAREEAGLARTRGDVEAAWRDYEPLAFSAEERRLAGAVAVAWRAYLALDDRLLALARSGDRAAGTALYTGEMRATYARLREGLAAVADYNVRGGHDAAEAGRAIYERAVWLMLAVGLLGVGLAAASGLWADRAILRRVARLTGVMGQLARRDYAFDLPCAARADELGDLARAMDTCRTGLREADALAAREAAERTARDRRAAALERHTQDFGQAVSGAMASLGRSAGDMRGAAQAVSEAVQRTRDGSAATAGGAEESARNLGDVAAATEQLSTSVGEITRQVSHAAEAAREAVERAQATPLHHG